MDTAVLAAVRAADVETAAPVVVARDCTFDVVRADTDWVEFAVSPRFSEFITTVPVRGLVVVVRSRTDCVDWAVWVARLLVVRDTAAVGVAGVVLDF